MEKEKLTKGQFLVALRQAAKSCDKDACQNGKDFLAHLSRGHMCGLDENNSYTKHMAQYMFRAAMEYKRQIPDALAMIGYAELAYETYCKTFEQADATTVE